MPERMRLSEEVSMETHRDLRDYALVHGFPHAKGFIAALRDEVPPEGVLLDIGCGSAKAINQAAKGLSRYRMRFFALDRNSPTKVHPAVQFLRRDFGDTGLADKSVSRVMSVCGLFMYAESPGDLSSHAAEMKRILDDNGTVTAVVDPVILLNQSRSQQLDDLNSQARNIARQIAQIEESIRAEFDDRRNRLTADLHENYRLKHHLRIAEERRIKAARTRFHAEFDSEIQAIRHEFYRTTQSQQTEINLRRQITTEIWAQSPTDAGTHFKVDIFKVLQDQGLQVEKRIIPHGGHGGMMIDDEIVLRIKKI